MSDASAERTPLIVAVGRTAFGRVNGLHRGLRAEHLAAGVLRHLAAQLADRGLTPPDDVILGNAVGGGGNVARLALLEAGLPVEVPGVSVDRQCGSGLEAVIQACRLVQAGAGSAYLAGGVESISTAPARAFRGDTGELEFYARARFAPDVLGDPDLGPAADQLAEHLGISRARQDAYALLSHQRALAADHDGQFRAERVDEPTTAAGSDEGLRPRINASLLARFVPVFSEHGTVTAGNSCQDADGAAAVLVLSEAAAQRAGYRGGLRFVAGASAGVHPRQPGLGAAAAIRKLGGLSPDFSGERVEIVEAFAAQVLACADDLGRDAAMFNRQGGALAWGHPYGASGAMSVLRLFSQCAEEGPAMGAVAGASIAGGLGVAARFEWVAV